MENEQEFGSGQEDGGWAALAEDSLFKGIFGAGRSTSLLMITSEVEVSGEKGRSQRATGLEIQVVIGSRRRPVSRAGTCLSLHFRMITLQHGGG